ncbi:unnamed protein product [Oncorhynchus mykiss]|uniref:Glypican-3 beta subunit n=1 Tax=Oncorhynchus mykiss TaxID=8022 RepID=A0A060X1Y0_ONCMY|nr:unnamed protein product [Oncorhynchus mykiss]
MFRAICTRVNFCWIWLAVLFLLKVEDVGAYSCHEVKTAFQVRQIGPLKWVPETPGTDVDLLVCKHQGPSCCTRKMEESYQEAVRRETLQNVRSYSFELKYLISGHATAFQGKERGESGMGWEGLLGNGVIVGQCLFCTAHYPP